MHPPPQSLHCCARRSFPSLLMGLFLESDASPFVKLRERRHGVGGCSQPCCAASPVWSFRDCRCCLTSLWTDGPGRNCPCGWRGGVSASWAACQGAPPQNQLYQNLCRQGQREALTAGLPVQGTLMQSWA